MNAVTNAFHLFFIVVLILGVHLNQLKELFFDARVPEFIYTDRSGQWLIHIILLHVKTEDAVIKDITGQHVLGVMDHLLRVEVHLDDHVRKVVLREIYFKLLNLLGVQLDVVLCLFFIYVRAQELIIRVI